MFVPVEKNLETKLQDKQNKKKKNEHKARA